MQREIKSYILRAGRLTNRQRLGLELWLKEYELIVDGSPLNLAKVFSRDADTVVEVGFGMGVSLATMAKNNPELNYIGIEVHRAGVGSLAADLYDQQLTNVRIVAHDAVEVFRTQFQDNSLAGVQIFFPDPWHKKRHNKRRLIQAQFIQLLIKKIKPGGFIHCATDWQEYAEHILKVLTEEPTLSNIQKEGGYAPRPLTRPLTKFEQRGKRLGHEVWDIIFTRSSSFEI